MAFPPGWLAYSDLPIGALEMIARPPSQTQQPKPAQPSLRPGANVLMGRNPLGFWIEGPAGSSDFSHPFTVFVSGDYARVSKGLIIADIAVEPCIGGVPISGDDTHSQPLLKLDASLVDALNQSWVCVLVIPNAAGKLEAKPAKPQVTVVQRAFPMSATGKGGLVALAQLFRKNDRWQVFPIAFYHYRYLTSQPAKGPRQHFFL